MTELVTCLHWLNIGCQALALQSSPETADLGVEPRVTPQVTAGDGIYGRFEGDMDFGFGLGGSYVGKGAWLDARTTLHYFSTAGLWLGLKTPADSSPSGESSLAFGVDIRPAFLPRFSENMQQGPAWLDLTLDAISLGLGPYFYFNEPDIAPQRSSRGLEVSLGTGFPLMGRASGLWLEARGVGRFPDGPERSDFGGLLVFSWHATFLSPLTQSDER